MLGNLVILSVLALGQTDVPRGQLVIVGGGPDDPAIRQRILDMAGGIKAHILVVPFASNAPNAGDGAAERWKEVGAKNVAILDVSDPKKAAQDIETADLIWMRGGSQVLLMETLSKAGLTAQIQERFRKGAIIAGTSAGAAVMSSSMIAGYSGRRGEPGWDVPKITDGLGLWPDVIVDQHFVKRNRSKRLDAAVRARPQLLGVGIEESTAVVVSGRGFEVIGKGPVMIFDHRKNANASKDKAVSLVKGPAEAKADGPATLPEVEFTPVTLSPGMKFDLDKGLLTPIPTPASGTAAVVSTAAASTAVTAPAEDASPR